MPLVSVITASYNCAALLPRAVRSALNQTWPEIEVIVVDDGSTDETQAVLARLAAEDSRVRHFRQENQGLPLTRNRAMAEARGDYFLTLDADDELTPDCAETFVHALQNEKALWGASAIIRRENGNDRVMRAPRPGANLVETMFCLRFPYRVFFYDRKAIEQTGGYDPAFKICEDWDLWARLARSGLPFTYVDRPLYIYCIQPKSLTKGHDFVPNLLAMEATYDRHFAPYLKTNRAIRLAYARNMHRLASEFLRRRGCLRPMLRTLFKSFKTDARFALNPLQKRLRRILGKNFRSRSAR